jgi:hypothetical protein
MNDSYSYYADVYDGRPGCSYGFYDPIESDDEVMLMEMRDYGMDTTNWEKYMANRDKSKRKTVTEMRMLGLDPAKVWWQDYATNRRKLNEICEELRNKAIKEDNKMSQVIIAGVSPEMDKWCSENCNGMTQEEVDKIFPPFPLFDSWQDAEKAGCIELSILMKEGKAKSPIVRYKVDEDQPK